MHSLPSISIPHESGTFVTIDEATVTHHCHPASMLYIEGHSWCHKFYGSGQMYTDTDSLLIVSHRAVSLPRTTSVLYLSSLPTPGNHWSFYSLHGFVFSDQHLSLSNTPPEGFSMSFRVLVTHFLLALNNIP